MSKYIYAYTVYAYTNRTPQKLIPCGCSFDSTGARNVIESTMANGFKIGKIEVQQFYADRPLDWKNAINSKTLFFPN